jgi:RNA polymerase sigma factor (sigma-70 family)
LGVDEAALVRLALAGDNDALEQLLTAHLPGLARMLRRLVPTQADAEDLAQETCLHAMTGLPGLRRPELFGAWLRTIAYNRARQWQRRRYAEAATWPRLWQPEWAPDLPEPAPGADEVPGPVPNLEFYLPRMFPPASLLEYLPAGAPVLHSPASLRRGTSR